MLTRCLAAGLLLALPSATFAWGPEGHQIVALIAYAHLTPEAKAATKSLLGDGKDIYDGEVAGWADIIRRTHPETGPYHYVDADVKNPAIDLKRDGDDGKNVVDGLADQIAFLGGDSTARQIKILNADGKPSAVDETRAQALRWVVHLVGDIHQPLHCCDREKDAGGNKVAVTFEGQKKETNLHSVWDGALLRTYVSGYLKQNNDRTKPARSTNNTRKTKNAAANEPSDDDTASLTDYAMWLDSRIPPAIAKTWAAGTPLDWANESHVVAVQSIYADLPRGDPVPIDSGYATKKQQILEQQLARGGIRLAAVLNNSLAKKPATRPSR